MENVIKGSEYIEIKQILFTNILGDSVKLLKRYEDIAIYQGDYHSTIFITKGSDILAKIESTYDSGDRDITFINQIREGYLK